MRTLLIPALALALLAPSARAQDDAKAIIEKAIKAHGGADVLNKYKAGKGKVKGPAKGSRAAFVAFFRPGEGADPAEYPAGIPQVLQLMNSDWTAKTAVDELIGPALSATRLSRSR